MTHEPDRENILADDIMKDSTKQDIQRHTYKSITGMKSILLCILLVLMAGNTDLSAQRRNPHMYHRDIEAGVGIQGVPNSNNGVDLRLDLSYGHFWGNGIGFRAGATYTPDMLEVGKAIGVPVSFAWRTVNMDRSYSTDDIDYDDYDSGYMLHQDYADYAKEQIATGFARFLTRIASSIEIDAGITPGYLSGKYADSFYMTGDLGLKTSWQIWRINLSINPAMHYLLTGRINMGKYRHEFRSNERWQLSLVFGVSFSL